MRTLLRFWVVAMMLPVIGCSKEFNAITEIENVATTEANQSFYVTVDEAVATAKQFLGAGDTRSRDLRLKNHTLYKALSGTRSEGEPIDVVFHVINFEDNQGYAIVSADSRATDVYAFSPTGNIDIDEAMENPGFQIFMNGATANYEEEVDGFGNPYRDSMILNPYVPPGGGSGPGGGTEDVTQYLITYYDGKPYHTKYSDGTIVDFVNPLLVVQWHQYSPYNSECPYTTNGSQAVAGCVPIAIAQIMSYHEWPTNCNEQTLDWGSIKDSDQIILPQDIVSVATLIREIGCVAGTTYGTSSGTQPSQVVPTFQYFGYTTGTLRDFSDDLAIYALENQNPVYARGNMSNGDGHGWVVDGYYHYKDLISYYSTKPPYSLYTTICTDSYTYFHCNWGWGGDDNGYYFSNAFKQFTTNVQMINNIKK